MGERFPRQPPVEVANDVGQYRVITLVPVGVDALLVHVRQLFVLCSDNSSGDKNTAQDMYAVMSNSRAVWKILATAKATITTTTTTTLQGALTHLILQ